MSTLRYLGRETENQLKDKLETDEGYQFKDSKTDMPPVALMSKSELTPYNPQYKKVSELDIEWDSIVIELDKYETNNIEGQVKVICEAYSNPNFTWFKDPGQGRPIKTHNVDGERQVLYDLHEDEHGYHLHLKVFRWTLNKETGNVAPAPNDTAKVADLQLEFINKKLTEFGFPEIGKSVKAFTNQTNKATEETKIEAVEIATSKKSVDEVIEDIANRAEFSEQSIATALDDDQKELALLLQKVKQKSAEIETKKEAKRLIDENKRLAFELKNKDGDLVQAVEKIGQLEFGIEKLKEIHEEELQEKDQKYRVILAERDNSINEQNQKIGELSQELNDVFDELTNANQTIEVQNVSLQETQDLLSETQKALKEKIELANSYKELIAMQKEQLEQSKELLREQQESFRKLQEENKKQAEALAKAIEDNKKQTEEMQKVVEDSKAKSVVIQTLTIENQTLVENNSKLSNIIHHFSQVTAKMKNNFDGFVNAVKEKLKTSPAMQKNLNEILQGVEKKQENVYKEVSKVANEAESQNLKVDKTLIEANKPKVDLMDKNVKDDKMKPQ